MLLISRWCASSTPTDVNDNNSMIYVNVVNGGITGGYPFIPYAISGGSVILAISCNDITGNTSSHPGITCPPPYIKKIGCPLS